jgi:hypothetical protein
MHASYIARMTQPRCFPFSQAQRAPPSTCRLAPRSPLPSHHKHARHTRCEKPHPAQQHISVMARITQHSAYKPRTPHRKLARSIQTHKPRTPARRPAQHQPLRGVQSSPHAHCRTHVTHSTAHSSDHPRHRPQKITPSHTRGLRATLTSELSGCPASTASCRRVGCCSSPSTCRAHEQPSRHTMHPTPPPTPASRPQRISVHRIASINIKSNESQSAHRMLSLTHNTVRITGVDTHTPTQAHRPRAAATRQRCTSSLKCHEATPQPLVKLLRIATAAARLLLLAATETVPCSAAPHTATQQRTLTTAHCRSRRKRATYT